ncbi:disease resistance protein TAO1-like [Neltuma alba]|uniref:disease resistance protein TAO1-like n=1 Tax=Neltuma alba TaxID=207710 RepID=UPI0010A5105C|nr:disease resistance protein TAO1-like [Prosopis alba]
MACRDNEADQIKEIVERVEKELCKQCPSEDNGEDLIGNEERMKDVESLLDKGSNDVRIICIWGMGSLGKTTLTRALYNKRHSEYEGFVFGEKVGEKSKNRGAEGVKKELISALLGDKNPHTSSYDMTRLRRKEVFIVFDDVDNYDQVNNLGLASNEAFQLFSSHAFGKDCPIPDPALERLAKKVTSEIFPLLKARRGYSIYSELKRLRETALLEVDEFGRISMHDLLREMGRQVVRDESPKHLRKRSRLWDPKEIYEILRGKARSRAIEGVRLNLREVREMRLSPGAFRSMPNLKILNFYFFLNCDGVEIDVEIPDGIDFLPEGLIKLRWMGYPLKSLPASFKAENLVQFQMPYSSLTRLWNGMQPYKRYPSPISHSALCMWLLKSGGIFSDLRKGRVRFRPFRNSHQWQVVLLRDLRRLEAGGYNELASRLLSKCDKMRALGVLWLPHCNELSKLPNDIRLLSSLRELNLSRTRVKKEKIRHVFVFTNCKKLNRRAIKAAEARALVEINKAIYGFARLEYPRVRLPKWFKFKSNEEDPMTVNLSSIPRPWDGRFFFGAVVSEKGTDTEVRWFVDGQYACRVEDSSFLVIKHTSSDHVCVWYRLDSLRQLKRKIEEKERDAQSRSYRPCVDIKFRLRKLYGRMIAEAKIKECGPPYVCSGIHALVVLSFNQCTSSLFSSDHRLPPRHQSAADFAINYKSTMGLGCPFHKEAVSSWMICPLLLDLEEFQQLD